MSDGPEITLFSGYEQKENRTTNYCLLMLRMLYEENPKFLDEALNALTGGGIQGKVGVRFHQQQKRKTSIPDGVILQESFALFIETKNFDWFYNDQLERHLEELNEELGTKVLLALSNFEVLDLDRFKAIDQICKERYEDEIIFAAATFEDFLVSIRQPGLPKNLIDLIEDLKFYLNTSGLLPTWKHMLDVCNCGRKPEEQEVHGTYICPAQRGHYSHNRSRFFGMYKDKCVRKVAEIKAVIDIEPGPEGKAKLRWKNVDNQARSALIQEARSILNAARPDAEESLRVFVLGPLYETLFEKDSPGGMMGSKQYFDVRHLEVEKAEDLAQVLNGRTWSDYTQIKSSK